MKRTIVGLVFVLVANVCHAQMIVTNKGDTVDFSSVVHGGALIAAYNNDSIQVVRYIDTSYGYSFPIPDFLEVIVTAREDMFVTLFPELNGTRNAFLIESFHLDSYDSLGHFVHDKIDRYKKGDAMNDNPDLILVQKSELPDQDTTQRTFKLQLGYYGDLFVHKWVFKKTKHGYIHYTFNATSTTYPKNIGRFEHLLDAIEILE